MWRRRIVLFRNDLISDYNLCVCVSVCLFWPLSPHSWSSIEIQARLKLFLPLFLPLFSIPFSVSLSSITPDFIWQMPLLAPYHQVQRRQPKTILLCPCSTTVLHFACMTHWLLQGSNKPELCQRNNFIRRTFRWWTNPLTTDMVVWFDRTGDASSVIT